MKSLIKDIIIAVLIVGAILILIRPTIVKEESMVPTLEENDYLIMSKQAYTIGEMETGDIIIFESDIIGTDGENKLLIKRAIGLPGDTIEIKDGEVILNGEVLEENYLNEDYTAGEIEEMTIPENKVFAMGDNRAVSNDSRSQSIGLVDMSDVEGQAVFRLYPFSEFGILE